MKKAQGNKSKSLNSPIPAHLDAVGREEWQSGNKHLETLLTTTTSSLSREIEAKTQALTHDIRAISDGFSNFASEIRNQNSQIASELRSSQKPHYGNWISAASLVLGVAIAMGALFRSQLMNMRDTQQLSYSALEAQINHLKNGSDRFSTKDWNREEERDIERDRHEESKNIEWQRLQDSQLLKLHIQMAKAEEWQRLQENSLNLRGEWMQGTQEKVNRLDERARYHMELDDPTEIHPKDVYREIQRLQIGPAQQVE